MLETGCAASKGLAVENLPGKGCKQVRMPFRKGRNLTQLSQALPLRLNHNLGQLHCEAQLERSIVLCPMAKKEQRCIKI
jgi:hypothetical protein